MRINEMQFYDKKAAQINNELPPSWLSSIVLDKQVRLISPELYKGRVVLDAGCGEGKLVRFFAQHGAKKAIGVDISCDYMKSKLSRKEMVIYGKRIWLPKDENVFFVHSNVEALPLKAGSVETVIAFALLHHIDEKPNFISECRRILVNQGRLVIVDPNGGHFLRKLMNKFGRKTGFLTEEENAIEANQLKDILRRFNFPIQKTKFESFFGDMSVQLSTIVFKRNRIFGKMIKYLTPICFVVDLFLDATLFKVFPSLAWRFFILSVKEG